MPRTSLLPESNQKTITEDPTPRHVRAMSGNYILYESASGYGLFEVANFDSLANSPDDITDVSRFGKSVKLAAFKPFTSAADALEQINAVSESQVRAETRTSRRCGRMVLHAARSVGVDGRSRTVGAPNRFLYLT